MPRLLTCNLQKGWPLFHGLLVDLFKFMEPYLRNAELVEPVNLSPRSLQSSFCIYLVQVMLLKLLYSLFVLCRCTFCTKELCECCLYYFMTSLNFCVTITSVFVTLSLPVASKCAMSFSVPFHGAWDFQIHLHLTWRFEETWIFPWLSLFQLDSIWLLFLLQIDLLPEITKAPRIMSDVEGALKSKHMKADVDEYLKVIELTCWFLILSKTFHNFPESSLLLCRDQMALHFWVIWSKNCCCLKMKLVLLGHAIMCLWLIHLFSTLASK
jgi:CCR4-NOT transcription complex subunit 1